MKAAESSPICGCELIALRRHVCTITTTHPEVFVLIQLVYASAATQPFTPDSLRSLLAKARARNALYDVSGMLLYHGGSFLQVLEGPETGVEQIAASIYKDPRHGNTRTLSKQVIQKREFHAWAMGFIDESQMHYRPAGHVDYHRDLPGLSDGATKARQFLRFFQQGLYRQHPAA